MLFQHWRVLKWKGFELWIFEDSKTFILYQTQVLSEILKNPKIKLQQRIYKIWRKINVDLKDNLFSLVKWPMQSFVTRHAKKVQFCDFVIIIYYVIKDLF